MIQVFSTKQKKNDNIYTMKVTENLIKYSCYVNK